MTAVRQAEAEGLTLLKADNNTGYKGVYFNKNGKAKPYKAMVYHCGKTVSLGYFATAEEAALCRAGLIEWGGVESFFANM